MENKALRKVGLKVTQPRVRILQILKASQGQHLSAEDIFRALIDAQEDVGLATVYRVITQFEEAGLVTRHNFAGGHSVFELTKEEHHDHMVCLETGKIIEFCDQDIEELQRKIAEKEGYDLVDHKLVLFVRPRFEESQTG